MTLSHRQLRLAVIIGGILVIFVGFTWLVGSRPTAQIDSYAACAQAGYPIQESNPPVCVAPQRRFVGPVAMQTDPVTVLNQPFELLVGGNSGGQYPKRWQMIHTQAEWQSYWAAVHASISMPPIIPVGFGTSDVVALSSGSKPTGGYRVEIQSISTAPTGTTVRVVETKPVNCVVTESVTNPYMIVRTAKLPDPVSFEVEQAEHRCP